MTKKLFALATVLALLCSFTLTVFADTYDLGKGDVTVAIDEQGTQYVNQNGIQAYDSAPIITGGKGSQSITVSTTGDDQANLTIKNVNAKTIEVGESNATITVSGSNTVANSDGAGIHVSSGNLTITGNGTLEANGDSSSAAIGSNRSENMSGSITIGGSATVTGTSKGYGAGIGTGNSGELSGSITIKDEAEVTATTSSWSGGAGIGSGNIGDITESGSITIEDNAQVNANASCGAGIGSGINGKMSGSITIEDNANVTATTQYGGAGIGSGSGMGYGGEMSGTITIGGAANVTAKANGTFSAGYSAGIGSGLNGTMSGTIAISTKATVDASSIGAASQGTMSGTIRYFDPDAVPTVIGSVSCYRVVDEKGVSVGYTSQQKDGVLTITARRDEASFLITQVQLKNLSERGVKTIVFITDGAASSLLVSDLLALAKPGDSFCLTHRGAEATLTLNGETLTDVRKPWSPEQK